MKMIKPFQFFSGFLLGASVSYFFDPRRGKYRRTYFVDKATRYVHDTEDILENAEKGLRFKSKGLVARLRSKLVKEKTPPTDEVLIARIRSSIGRVAIHPHSIEVRANQGNVILKGTAMPYEVPEILAKVRSVRGVHHVKNQIKPPEPVSTAQPKS